MSQTITLEARNKSLIALILETQETFLDAHFDFVGLQRPPDKGLSDAMVEIVQSTDKDITTQLLNRDGTNFDLTGVTSLQMGIFQRTPIRVMISATAGFATGAPSDGLALFSIPNSATNYIGFARGIVTGVKAGKNFAFETFEVKYSENPFVPLP
jgi:hypothetical protein